MPVASGNLVSKGERQCSRRLVGYSEAIVNWRNISITLKMPLQNVKKPTN